MRQRYEMTQEDLESIKDYSCRTPLIMLQCGMPTSPQERSNAAWKVLGDKMGFDYMTVEPTGEGDRFFTAKAMCAESERREHEQGK